MTKEHKRLLRLWATGKATAAQMSKCMELDRRAKVNSEKHPPPGYVVAGFLRGYDFVGLPEHALSTDTPLYMRSPQRKS